jgi:hypothetical protein
MSLPRLRFGLVRHDGKRVNLDREQYIIVQPAGGSPAMACDVSPVAEATVERCHCHSPHPPEF